MGTAIGVVLAFIVGILVGVIGGVFIMKRIIEKRINKGIGDAGKAAINLFKDKFKEASLIEKTGDEIARNYHNG